MVIETTEGPTTVKSGRKYVFSPILREEFDRERHIPITDAHAMIRGDERLDEGLLSKAVSEERVKVYDFDGVDHVDRLDLGRVFHKNPGRGKALSIGRYFSDGVDDPLGAETYEPRALKIMGADGSTVFQMDDAQFPPSWSGTDARMVAQKYFYKPNDPEQKERLQEKIGTDHENSPAHLIRRTTGFFVEEGKRLGYFASDDDAESFRRELEALQIQRRFAFNSPVQFNAGLFTEYGIHGSKSHNYWRNPETGEVTHVGEDGNVHPQCHACFIKGPQDDLESILMQFRNEGRVFAGGSGIGMDLGALREKGGRISRGGVSSGTMSFLKPINASAGSIKSGGTTRRAARMTTMRSYHPDIMEFITTKPGEDKKALILMRNGYEGGMDGEAVGTVGLQHTNISVRMFADDFEKARDGGDIELRSVIDDSVVGTVSADEMLKRIAFGSWRIGDPGMQYETKIQEMHTCSNSGRQNSTNPCSEYLFLDDTSCNLASLNMLAFCDEQGNLNVDEFQRAARLVAVASDIANDAASYPIQDIATISPEFRTIGVGYANIGAWLMRRGVPYDSDEGRALVGAVTALLTGSVYEQSAELANKLEPFTHFELNRKPMLEVMGKHQRSLDDIAWEHVPTDLEAAAKKSWKSVVREGRKHGYRNAQASVIAPTGTISFLMGCDTTSGEPAAALRVKKHLAGGGEETLVVDEVPNALRNLGYNPAQREDIEAFIKENNTARGAPHMDPKHYAVFDTAFGDGKAEGLGSIPFEGHVRMVGAMQPFVSGAISKTNNLPETATVKDVYDGFVLGHKLRLKAIAVFRNKSKPTTALSFGEQNLRELKRGEKEEPPSLRDAFESEVQINGTPIHVIVSDYEDGRPAQVAFLSCTTDSTLGGLLTVSGIAASKALKRGVDLEDVVEGWRGHGFQPQGLVHGHPHIKTASSPLDFAAKFLRLEYKGDTEMADDPESVDVTQLRGFKNGAFRTYERAQVDGWDFDQVMADPEFGGFVEPKNDKHGTLPKNGRTNNQGQCCSACGHMMVQTAPSCFSCTNCSASRGGCGS